MYTPYLLRRLVLQTGAGLVSFTLSLSASAAWDFQLDDARLLSDPAYLPQQGQIHGVTGYSLLERVGEVYNNVNIKDHTIDVKSESVSQSVAYGVTDTLSIKINAIYATSIKTTNDYFATPDTKLNADGFDDPSIGMTWRVIEQDDKPFSLDLSVAYSPRLIDAKWPSTTEKGTVARGGSGTMLGLAISREMMDVTFQLYGYANFLSERKVLDLTTHSSFTFASASQFTVGLSTQARLNDYFAVNVGVGEMLGYRSNTLEQSSAAIGVGTGDVAMFNAAVIYQITPNRWAVALTYNYFGFSDLTTTYKTQTHLNTTTRNESASAIGLMMHYAFY